MMHSPKPWVVQRDGKYTNHFTIYSDGYSLYDGNRFTGYPVALHVAHRYDAELIKAAPLLLEVCEKALSAIERLRGRLLEKDPAAVLTRELREAIAEAGGGDG